MNRNALLIFIKNPIPGKVKTRLAATVGDDMALKIYRELLGHTRSIAESIQADRFVFYSHFIDETDEWHPSKFNKRLQKGDDLGIRMSTAFQEVLSTYEKAVIIGSDCATLSTEMVEEAFRLLGQHDGVMGPAMDGGYYLLGMKEYLPKLFQDIVWSTDEVGSQTLMRFNEMKKNYALLPLLSDIDYEEDWKKYGWEIE
ncbi:MAG: TIGR04282 family arsenosugar biosynthesis glycosyltransferase [Bacteroidota bacterium]